MELTFWSICFLRYSETLQQVVAGSTVHLDYNATISSNTQVLDDIDIVEKVYCSTTKLEIYFSAGSDYSARISLHDLLKKKGTIVHGGSEWGCMNNETNQAIPFYYRVFECKVLENGTMILDVEPCSPFMAFETLSWKIHSDSTVSTSTVFQRGWNKTLNSTKKIPDMRRSKSESSMGNASDRKTRDEYNWAPDPLIFSFDMLDPLCSRTVDCTNREESSFTAAASFGFSPMKYFWSIDLYANLIHPYIHVRQNTMWFSTTEKYSLGTSVNFSPRFSLSLRRKFPVIRKFPIPKLGYGFSIGPVRFIFGLAAKMDLEIDLSFPLGTYMDVQCSAQRTTKTGFEYDGSRYTRIHEDSGLVPTSSQQYGPMSVSFELHIQPELSFGLEASFVIANTGLQLQVLVGLEV
jgi:hypothetical protein